MFNENMLNKYSLEEQKIGIFTDGKPIYKKCFQGTKNNAENVIVTSLVDLKIDTIVKMEIISNDRDGRWFHEFNWQAEDKMDLYSSGGSIFIRTGSAYPVLPMKWWVTLEYTKTTD